MGRKRKKSSNSLKASINAAPSAIGKKKKKSSSSLKASNNAVPNLYNSLLHDILANLLSIKESNGLVIGTNAVLRAIEKCSVDVVLLVKRKSSSFIYHALNLWCNNTNTLFFQLHDTDTIALDPKVCKSTTYGIKASALDKKEKFSVLVERIGIARNSLKCRMERRENLSSNSNPGINDNVITNAKYEDVLPDMNCESVSDRKNVNIKDLFHRKHFVNKPKFIGKAEAFISLEEYSTSESDFPNYNVSSQKISVSIK